AATAGSSRTAVSTALAREFKLWKTALTPQQAVAMSQSLTADVNTDDAPGRQQQLVGVLYCATERADGTVELLLMDGPRGLPGKAGTLPVTEIPLVRVVCRDPEVANRALAALSGCRSPDQTLAAATQANQLPVLGISHVSPAPPSPPGPA
ncbi:hypothetical protein HaLaN_32681, partial [Haematococcus lacustris]